MVRVQRPPVHHHARSRREEIHEIGLAEVARIRAEMDGGDRAAAASRGGFPAFMEFLRTDARFFFDARRRTCWPAYRDIAKRADPELVRLFGRLPRLPYGVRPGAGLRREVADDRLLRAGLARRRGRPGYFYANTYDLRSRPQWEMEALTLHEAVPGHHLQIALAQELADVPEFRRHGFYTAYIEGWGLYAESLGDGDGLLHRTPTTRFGQLTYEMWRAVRLVVDTGMHALGWSREQAIDYFERERRQGRARHRRGGRPLHRLARPGPGLQDRRAEDQGAAGGGQRTLGARFDVRGFHDQVLGQGALPLDVLADRLRAWAA